MGIVVEAHAPHRNDGPPVVALKIRVLRNRDLVQCRWILWGSGTESSSTKAAVEPLFGINPESVAFRTLMYTDTKPGGL
jgi:hypothetical protein